jgi:hypothetical protein
MAYSTNGIDFRRPTNAKDGILIDRAGVPDAVVLPSGRILVYFIDGCRQPDSTKRERTGITLAVSDKLGALGSWVYKDVRFLNIPSEFGPGLADPNVVLLPNGNLRLFVLAFHPGKDGSMKGDIFSFVSVDGGFTFSYEGLRYEDLADPENYRFSDSNWQIISGGPRGHALSTDGGNTFQTLGPFTDSQGAVHEIAVTDRPGEYRSYLSSSNGIRSYLSSSAPWTKWVEESGYRLQLDRTTGFESCEVAVPTVLKLGPGNYLMVYLTVIPGCGCAEDPICP